MSMLEIKLKLLVKLEEIDAISFKRSWIWFLGGMGLNNLKFGYESDAISVAEASEVLKVIQVLKVEGSDSE
ncbi:hypothetical protein A2U01_0007672, partial [Trifolium medium]|nr:hypothetical protein [Trifolium medium]